MLEQAVNRLGFSARAYHRVLKVARTIADLAGRRDLAAAHVAEAIQLRRGLQKEVPIGNSPNPYHSSSGQGPD